MKRALLILLMVATGAWASKQDYPSRVDTGYVAPGKTWLGQAGSVFKVTAITPDTIKNGFLVPAGFHVVFSNGSSADFGRLAVDTAAVGILTTSGKTTLGDAAGDSTVNNGNLFLKAGSTSTPSVVGISDPNTGIAWLGNDTLSLISGGAERFRWPYVIGRPVQQIGAAANVGGGIQFVAANIPYWYQMFDNAKFFFGYGNWADSPDSIYMAIWPTGKLTLGAGTAADSTVTVTGGLSTTGGAKIGGALNVTGVATFTADILPAADNGPNIGSVAATVDSIFIHVAAVVGDMLWLDGESDVAAIKAIRPDTTRKHPIHGVPLVDDNTLPSKIVLCYGDDGTHKVVDPATGDTTEVAHRRGERVLRADGRAYVDPLAAIGQLQGAIRELAATDSALAADLNRPELAGRSLGDWIVYLIAAVGALGTWNATQRKQINDLEARIAKLEGKAPTPPNLEG